MPAHPLSTVATEATPIGRMIRCPRCCWTARVPRQNARVAASKLRKQLREHLELHHLILEAMRAEADKA